MRRNYVKSSVRRRGNRRNPRFERAPFCPSIVHERTAPNLRTRRHLRPRLQIGIAFARDGLSEAGRGPPGRGRGATEMGTERVASTRSVLRSIDDEPKRNGHRDERDDERNRTPAGHRKAPGSKGKEMTLKLEAIASIVRATRLGKTITRNEEGDVIMDQQTTNRGVNLGVRAWKRGRLSSPDAREAGPAGVRSLTTSSKLRRVSPLTPTRNVTSGCLRIGRDVGALAERSSDGAQAPGRSRLEGVEGSPPRERRPRRGASLTDKHPSRNDMA
jgi:hypothetical protein